MVTAYPANYPTAAPLRTADRTMAKAKILVVEDDRSLADVLEYNLRQDGYETYVAYDGQDGLNQSKLRSPDLVVLDLMLPIIDGLEICRRIRADPVTKKQLVLMLTAKGEETDQVAGFSVGVDDYVAKPFSVRVLLERIKALLRRVTSPTQPGDILVSQGVLVDRERHRVTANEEVLDLTPSEFGLLEALIRQPGRVFSRSELIDAALGGDSLVLERTIDVHVRALRKKLGDHADLVETVRGVGYRFRDPAGVR
ncbi:response regulator [Botrimarina mediterranea]|uniref:Phosphate regulon transcriptional regulatory protein PhoB n=1 Tax=Botrimarina mediterranea TaxID=2528022 RepID=A0A518KDA0_9BACT|nr:response regulator [Botrimarina mediterranea]QDV75772.1 Phosphate regulon transcriptional regulatory protein PhoB [Botrimarina mediterranea]QDV80370.1 Phosphate regulon transcriptional regulatory protein PhoB [Planctomycetes bacterium K2D]